MKLGFFAANYAHLSLEEVAKIMSEHGYEMMEIPAYIGNGQFDCDEILKGNNAETLKKMLAVGRGYGRTVQRNEGRKDQVRNGEPYQDGAGGERAGGSGGKRLYGSDELGEVFSVSVPPGMGNDGEGFREVFHADPGQIQGIWSEVCGRAASEQLHL